MTLKQGMWSTPVMTLQRNLETLGYGDFIPTGFFGPLTKQAVQMFQLDKGLPSTGVFGEVEESKMAVAISDFKRELIYKTAISFFGKDASPNDLAPDELGCADSVCAILFKSLKEPGVKYTVSTAQLYRELSYSYNWMMVQIPKRGDVIISPTGWGNGGLSNGHTGIMVSENEIASNNSNTGKFEQNYTIQTWKDRYVKLGGFPVFYFRKL